MEDEFDALANEDWLSLDGREEYWSDWHWELWAEEPLGDVLSGTLL